MTQDSQWQRYEVFVQESEKSAPADSGSVHAPDGELALLNARDVFVRRPDCFRLWVVPASAIFSKTAEELANEPLQVTSGEAGSPQTYYVSYKLKPAGTQVVQGIVEAASPLDALRLGIERFAQGSASGRQPWVWWVFPAGQVIQSADADRESWFAPAYDKPFRMSTDFKVVSAMRALKEKKGTTVDEGGSRGS